MGDPPKACTLRSSGNCGDPSLIIIRESPIWISACRTLPSASMSRIDSAAPNALL